MPQSTDDVPEGKCQYQCPDCGKRSKLKDNDSKGKAAVRAQISGNKSSHYTRRRTDPNECPGWTASEELAATLAENNADSMVGNCSRH
jgi:hypothetical protein